MQLAMTLLLSRVRTHARTGHQILFYGLRKFASRAHTRVRAARQNSLVIRPLWKNIQRGTLLRPPPVPIAML